MFNLDLVFIVPFHSRVPSFQKGIIAEISELSEAIHLLFTQGFHLQFFKNTSEVAFFSWFHNYVVDRFAVVLVKNETIQN